MSHFLSAAHSSQPLAVGNLAPKTLNYCPRYPLNPFHPLASLSYPTRSVSGMMASRRPSDGAMKAAVIYEAGGPEAFKVEKRQIPKPVGG